LTLSHLLSGIALVMAPAIVVGEIRAAGGGAIRYLLGLASGLLLGTLIVLLEWHLGKFLWQRSQTLPDRGQNIVAIGLFALQFVWIILAMICGSQLAHLILKFAV
jgi:uncharacterized membrane protein YGL010W